MWRGVLVRRAPRWRRGGEQVLGLLVLAHGARRTPPLSNTAARRAAPASPPGPRSTSLSAPPALMEKTELIQKAKLAEQAERYDDLATCMKA